MTKIQKKYLTRAQKIAVLLRIAPFVRMVSLTGSLVSGKATEESDIDLFIVTQRNRIWSGRIFATLMVNLTGLRRYDEKISGRICLNCYQTENSLEIHPQNKKNALDYSQMVVLFQKDHLYEVFKYQNEWMKKFKVNFRKQERRQFKNLLFLPLYLVQKIGEVIFETFFNGWGEKILRKYQKRRIISDQRTKKSPKNAIFISNTELRFHPLKGLKKE